MLAFKIYLSLSGIIKLFEFLKTQYLNIVDFKFINAANLKSNAF